MKLIRASQNRDEARTQLMARFQFTERQANAILDLRLYQLTGLEHDKINEEYREISEKDRLLPRCVGQRSDGQGHNERRASGDPEES